VIFSVDKDGWVRHPEIKLPIIYFAFDKSDIGTSERPKLDKTAEFLQGSKYCLIIEGNCDERGSEEYNRALGERRAIAIKDYLQAKGIAADRMKTISYGEDKPAVEGHTPEAWATNRRGDLGQNPLETVYQKFPGPVFSAFFLPPFEIQIP
jgi:peptidoglycan-associated lipoprotein